MIRFGSLAEALSDHLIGRALFDRVTEASIDLPDGQLDSLRVWAEERRWTSAREQVPGFTFGRFDGLPRGHDAYGTQKLLAQFAHAGCELVLILRDADGVAEREASIRDGTRAFLEKFNAKLVVCVGVPSLELESWVLCGFQAKSPRERAALSLLKEELTFDPTLAPERLTDRMDDGVKSPKRALRVLSEDDPVRERACWLEAPLESLRDRGQHNGLRSFLLEAAASARRVFAR